MGGKEDMNDLLERLQRDVKEDQTAATYYTVGVIEAIIESDRSGEEKINRIKQALEALEAYTPA